MLHRFSNYASTDPPKEMLHRFSNYASTDPPAENNWETGLVIDLAMPCTRKNEVDSFRTS